MRLRLGSLWRGTCGGEVVNSCVKFVQVPMVVVTHKLAHFCLNQLMAKKSGANGEVSLAKRLAVRQCSTLAEIR